MSKCIPSGLLALSLCLPACGDDAPQETPSPTPSPAQETATPSPTPTLPEPSFTIDLAERENTSFIRNTVSFEGEAPYVYESLVLTNMSGFEADVAEVVQSFSLFMHVITADLFGPITPEQCDTLQTSAQTLATLFTPHVGAERYILLLQHDASAGEEVFVEGTTLVVLNGDEDGGTPEGELDGFLVFMNHNPWQALVDSFDYEACIAGEEPWDTQSVNDSYEDWSLHEGSLSISSHTDTGISATLSEVIIDKNHSVAGRLTPTEMSASVTLVTTTDVSKNTVD